MLFDVKISYLDDIFQNFLKEKILIIGLELFTLLIKLF